MNAHEHRWKETGRTGFHCTPYPVRYVRCITCAQNGYRLMPGLTRHGRPLSSEIVYTWSDDDPPEGLDEAAA